MNKRLINLNIKILNEKRIKLISAINYVKTCEPNECNLNLIHKHEAEVADIDKIIKLLREGDK